MISSTTLLRTIVEKAKMTAVTAIAPAKAPASTAMKPPTEKAPADSSPPRASITRATPTLAPLLMPKMPGPASGLRKAVWSSSPLTASELPAIIAVTADGRRVSVTMKCHVWLLVPRPSIMPSTSDAGMFTAPVVMLRANSKAVLTASSSMVRVVRFMVQSCGSSAAVGCR